MTGRPVNKLAIASNFSMVAQGYDAWATAQAEIARGLVARLPSAFAPRMMVDLGCGTGLLSSLLVERFPEAELLGLDIAEGMIEVCRRRWEGNARTRFVVADAEEPSQVRPADLVASSCTTQWFDRPAETLRMWIDALASGGILDCAVLLRGSFAELEAAYREAVGTPFSGLPLWDADVAPQIAEAAGLRIHCTDVENITAQYSSARAALRSFRRIGAMLRGQPDYKPLDVAHARRLVKCYGIATVTHRVQYLVAGGKR
jgi:malonyl-CoA O-methyltransferase